MEKEIGNYVRTKINSFARDSGTLEQSGSKAHLAQLRRGIGKSPGELPELWGLFLKDMPETWMSPNGEPSYAEWAIYVALTLFALHQQSHAEPMHVEGEEHRLGRAVRKLVKDEADEENVRKKLSIMARSENMTELSHHLKTIVRLLGNHDVKLDYVELTKDLYCFQFGNYADRIRLKWGQDFYRSVKANEKGEGNEDEES